MHRRRGHDRIRVYLEIGKQRVFAGAVDWPGWCRSGKGEQAALEALAAYGARYASVLRGTTLRFEQAKDASVFEVVERLQGDATTDFGAPGKAPAIDSEEMDDSELNRSQALLKACWKAFDAAVDAAQGKELTKGPRGGGRDLEKIVEHVLEAETAYLGRIGTKYGSGEKGGPTTELVRIRPLILGALTAVACGEPVRTGPRGGARWTPRYFVRRSAWHVLDHAWEIEDRTSPKGA